MVFTFFILRPHQNNSPTNYVPPKLGDPMEI